MFVVDYMQVHQGRDLSPGVYGIMNIPNKTPFHGRKNNIQRLAIGQIWEVKAKRLATNLDFWFGDKLLIVSIRSNFHTVQVSCFGVEKFVPSWAILTHCKLIS